MPPSLKSSKIPTVASEPSEFWNDVLESFEKQWSSQDGFLDAFVTEHQLSESPEGLSELVRADLDRRYTAGLEVDLARYFERYPNLRQCSDWVQAICFEDYRARNSRGLTVTPSRWGVYPEAKSLTWWMELQSKSTSETANQRSQSIHLQPPEIGSAFGEFKLLGLLGEGAFSQVYLATQPGLASRYVALKIVRRAFDEPAHLARLQHTGIVPLYSMHRIGAYTALCMPYCGAATLSDWLVKYEKTSRRDGQSLVRTIKEAELRITRRNGDTEPTREETTTPSQRRLLVEGNHHLLDKLMRLGPKESLLWLARRIAAGLAHAHDRNVVHGDLKPANILIRNDGEPALIDFNLSQSSDNVVASVAGGTLPYMSPEQLKMLLGRSMHMSARSDIFSFGILLYQLFEGRHPFEIPISSAEIDLEKAIDDKEVQSPMRSRVASPGVRSIVRKCLKFDPESRYASGSELLEDLDRESENLPLKYAQDDFFQSRLPKYVKRNPRHLLSALTILVVGGLVLLGWMGWNWRNESIRLSAEQAVRDWREGSHEHLEFLYAPVVSQPKAIIDRVEDAYASLLGNDIAITERSAPWNRLSRSDQQRLALELADHSLIAASLALEHSDSLDETDRSKVRHWLAIHGQMSQQKSGGTIARLLSKQLEARDALTTPTLEMLEPESAARQSLSPTEQLLIARMLDHMGKSKESLSWTEHLAPQDSIASSYWLIVGDSQVAVGHYDSAQRSYAMALQKAPSSTAIRLRLASLYERKSEWQNAEHEYQQVIDISKPHGSVYADRSRVREKLNKIEDSISDLDRAIELQPGANRFLLMRSRLNLRSGREAQAKADYQMAMRLSPNTTDDWISRALAQLPRYPERALADLRAAQAIEPFRFEVLQNIAHVLSEHLHENVKALEPLEQLIARRPFNEMARAGRCVLLAREGFVDKALQDIDFLMDSPSGVEPATLYQIGCAYALISNHHPPSRERAIEYLARAIMRGYGADLLENDPDLSHVQNAPEFLSLVTVCRLVQDQTALSTLEHEDKKPHANDSSPPKQSKP